jgi:hypothetical protein
MQSAYSEKEENPEFWFNLKTMSVEVGKKSAAAYRVGPFLTRQEAEQALKTLGERSAAWSEEED